MPVRSNVRKSIKKKNQQSMLGMIFLSFAIIAGALILKKQNGEVQAATTPTMFVSQYDTIMLPVPVEPVTAGRKMSEVRFKNVAFPVHQVPEGAIESVDQVLNSVALSPLPANLPLFRKNFSSVAFSSNAVVDKIPPGMRAMTIRVDATSSVEGWAGSGSVVDVILIEKDRTAVVAEKVKILSAERSVSPIEGTAAPSVPSTVTLLVTQEQCLAINTAIPMGKIAFALRSAKDDENWASTQFTSDYLKAGSVVTDGKGAITGFVSTKNSSEKKLFALSDGKWIETKVVPDGFFVDSNEKVE